jgi:hypothetical protein
MFVLFALLVFFQIVRAVSMRCRGWFHFLAKLGFGLTAWITIPVLIIYGTHLRFCNLGRVCSGDYYEGEAPLPAYYLAKSGKFMQVTIPMMYIIWLCTLPCCIASFKDGAWKDRQLGYKIVKHVLKPGYEPVFQAFKD